MNPSTRTASHALPGTDVPESLSDMLALAQALSEADLFMPEELRGKPGNLLAVMVRARALDIPLAMAWDELYITGPDQDVAMTARLARALARRAGHRIAYPESSRHHAVALLQCAGEDTPHEVRFTIQEAAAMNLIKPDRHGRNPYEEQPQNMLIARVTMRAVTWYCPEVLLGLGAPHLSTADFEAPVQVDSDVLTAYRRDHKELVEAVLRKVSALETEEKDPGERLSALREAFLEAREGGVLEFAAQEGGDRTVRQVVVAAMEAAEAQARQAPAPAGDAVAASPPPAPADAPQDPPAPAQPPQAPPAAAPPPKARRPRKAAAKKTTGAAKKAARPRATLAPVPAPADAPQAPPAPARPQALACGCDRDRVIIAGVHECGEAQ